MVKVLYKESETVLTKPKLPEGFQQIIFKGQVSKGPRVPGHLVHNSDWLMAR